MKRCIKETTTLRDEPSADESLFLVLIYQFLILGRVQFKIIGHQLNLKMFTFEGFFLKVL